MRSLAALTQPPGVRSPPAGNPASDMDHSLVASDSSSQVESVTSERAARKRWPVTSQTPPPEYLI